VHDCHEVNELAVVVDHVVCTVDLRSEVLL
jgi:hypothetical protein